MRIILLTLGSFGDVNPFIGLGLALQKRGHDVVMIANGYFEPILRRLGLPSRPLVPLKFMWICCTIRILGIIKEGLFYSLGTAWQLFPKLSPK
jgi:hypothetical protein